MNVVMLQAKALGAPIQMPRLSQITQYHRVITFLLGSRDAHHLRFIEKKL
jgi:hypothetical protein